MGMQYQKMFHGTLEEEVLTTDSGMGRTGVWTARAAVAFRMTTMSSKLVVHYGRDGTENMVTLQMSNRFPVRVQGSTTWQELLSDNTQDSFRIVYRSRTLTIVGFRFPNDGTVHGPAGLINIDCVETPQKVGAVDA